MSETKRLKGTAGAMELRKVCATLLSPGDLIKLESSNQYKAEVTKNVSSPILIEREGDLITIAKKSGQDNLGNIDFQFKFKLSFIENRTEWWPVFFNDSAGRTIEAVVHVGGKALTNIQKQNELIELANTWAKSLSSQTLTRTIDGIV